MSSWPFRFLRWFCPPELLEEIEGDLLQRYERDLKKPSDGYKYANRRLAWNTLRFFRPDILLRNKFALNYIPMHLLQNNLLMAFRTMRKDRLFSSINIFGLTFSMAACLLIFQYAFFELNYDRFQPNAEKTFRVYASNYQDGNLQSQSALAPAYVAPTLKEKLTGIEQTTRLVSTRWWFDCTLAYSKNNDYRIFNERDLYYADPSIFSVFSYPLIKGDSKTALDQPHSIVLASSVAEKYFGSEEPLGKTMRLKGSGEDHDYIVTGIMTDPLPNSHLIPTILASISTLEPTVNFNTTDTYTYVQLADPLQRGAFQASLDQLVSEVAPPKNGFHTELNLEAITDIHLYSSLQDDMKPARNRKSIYFLLLVAVVVLVMAWINYVNLSTARSFARAKEVGIRKVSGASRIQIVFQFLTETFVFNLTGITCAAALVYLGAPLFYQWMDVALPAPFLLFGKSSASGYFILVVFLVGVFISGIFPALTLSSFNPIRVLKGKFLSGHRGTLPRKVTVVFQFACAIALTMAVLIFNQQFQFMRAQDLQVDIAQTLIVKSPVNVDSGYLRKLEAFKNELKGLSVVTNISSSSSVPGYAIGWRGDVRKENEDKGRDFTINVIDPDFIEAYNIKLLAGRHFVPADFPLAHFGDKLEPVALNEEAIRQLDFKKAEDAIGAYVYWGNNRCVVVGVVNNFHQESLKQAIQPQLFTAGMGPTLSLKLTVDKTLLANSIVQIQKAWNSHFPNNAFEYSLLEDNFEKQYAADEQVAKLFNFFCLLALLISCLGLFALSLFSVQQRTKEISIRKVLGAPIAHLLHLLTREYLTLILIAAAMALPISIWGINEWLLSFAFHVTPRAWLFALPILLIAIIALLTVGGQTIKVILKNPTETLKHE